MHLTNTFKDELTPYLKQYSLCNAIDNSISLLHSHRIHKKRNPLQSANVFHFVHFMWLYTSSSFHNRYFNKQ